MREIKFRAWFKPLKRMYMVKELVFNRNKSIRIITSNTGGTAPNSFELIQFTGLKDKNGKEIYEGDILQSYPTKDVWFIVGFGKNKDNDSFGFTLESTRNDGTYAFETSVRKMEVIGNKFENLELLK